MEEKRWVCVGIKDILEEASWPAAHPETTVYLLWWRWSSWGPGLLWSQRLMPNTGRKVIRFKRGGRILESKCHVCIA